MIEPVEIVIARDHRFKKRPIKPGNTKPSPGCAVCGEAMTNPCHVGAPPSMNNHSIAFNKNAFASQKAVWEHAICLELDRSGLQRGVKIADEWYGIQSISVEVLIGFEDYRERDEGNHRWMIEKALGDCFVNGYGYATGSKRNGNYEWHQVIEGGWLPSDSFWPTRRYSMGNLQGRHTPKESSTTLMIFPSADPPYVDPRVTR